MSLHYSLDALKLGTPAGFSGTGKNPLRRHGPRLHFLIPPDFTRLPSPYLPSFTGFSLVDRAFDSILPSFVFRLDSFSLDFCPYLPSFTGFCLVLLAFDLTLSSFFC